MIFDIQKASTLKRASAFLLDLILFAVLAVGVAALISLACDYDYHVEQFEVNSQFYQKEIDAMYGEGFSIETPEQFDALSPEAQEAFKIAKVSLSKVVNFTLLMVSLGIFVSILVLEFIVPLIMKNGQTVGKKVFGIAVIHQNGVRVNTITMFIRAILGKYTVETMVPVLLVYMLFMIPGSAIASVVVLGLLVVLEIVLFFTSKGMHTFIHDVFAKTVCVDLASQMVFDTEEDMHAFRRNAYAEKSGEINSDGIYTGTSAISASLVEKSSLPSNDVSSTTESPAVEQSSTDTTTEE